LATVITGQNLPPPQSPFVDPKTGILSYDGYQFLLNLISNALSAGITSSVGSGIVAAGVNQATATLLTNDWNEVDSGTGGGVLLASLQSGQSQLVFNNTGGSISVYPPPGSNIDALLTNQAFVLGAGVRTTFDFFSSTQIRS